MSTDPKPTGAGDGSDELLIPYPGRSGRGLLFGGLFGVGFAAASVWILIVIWRLPVESGEDAVLAVLLTALMTSSGALIALGTALFLIQSWRATRGAWWLRLTASGLEINERLGRPRRYQWNDFERFVLVPTTADLGSTELAPQLTYGEKVAQGIKAGGAVVVVVGLVPAFQLVPTYPRSYAHKRINRAYRTYQGPTPDGLVVEFWDRPYDQAVDLLNEWLMRYRNT